MPDEVRVLSSVPDLQKARGSNQASVKVGEAHPTYSPIESVDTFLKLCLATLALADCVLDHMGQNVSEMLRAVRVSEPHRPRRGGLNRGSASPVVTAQSSFLTGALLALSPALAPHPALMRKRWHKFARFSADHVWASAAVWEGRAE